MAESIGYALVLLAYFVSPCVLVIAGVTAAFPTRHRRTAITVVAGCVAFTLLVISLTIFTSGFA